MPTKTATKRLTADAFYDYAHRPENYGRFLELERGEVVEMASPGKRHGFVCCNVAAVLSIYAQKQGSGYCVTNDSGLIVERKPDTVRGPDVSYYDDGEDIDTMTRKYSDKAPLLVVEVRSPTDTDRRTQKRISEYLRMGVPLVWLVDPEDRFVTVFKPNEIHQVLDEPDELIGGTVLPGFRCKVVDLFHTPGRSKTTNGKKKN